MAGERESLEALLARVRAATEADEAIDAAVEAVFDPERPGWRAAHNYHHPRERYPAPEKVTASLDAVIALIGRTLPNWSWSVGRQGGRFRGSLTETSPCRPMPVTAKGGATAGLVLIEALLLVHLHRIDAHADA